MEWMFLDLSFLCMGAAKMRSAAAKTVRMNTIQASVSTMLY